jgi:TRAP-type C4-dicarboxylate transport system substrate-binding protein
MDRSLSRRRLIVAGAALGAGVAMPAIRTSADESITLRTVTPYTPKMYLSHPIFVFKDTVEAKTNGRIKINILGGEEVIPSLQQFDGLRNGVVDVIVGVTSYYPGTVPEALALLYAQKTPAEQRKNGFYELMRRIHLEKGNVIYLANAGGTPGKAFRLYLRKKIDKPDLTGFKIRVSPVYTALVHGLHGTPVSIPFADTYSALERGVVDGFGATYAGIGDYALPEVAKFVVDHPFYSLNEAILINKSKWDSLPADLRKTLDDLAPEYELAVGKYMDDYLKGEDDRLKAQKMEFIHFSPADAKHYLEVAYKGGWDAFLKKNPQDGPKIKELCE